MRPKERIPIYKRLLTDPKNRVTFLRYILGHPKPGDQLTIETGLLVDLDYDKLPYLTEEFWKYFEEYPDLRLGQAFHNFHSVSVTDFHNEGYDILHKLKIGDPSEYMLWKEHKKSFKPLCKLTIQHLKNIYSSYNYKLPLSYQETIKNLIKNK